MKVGDEVFLPKLGSSSSAAPAAIEMDKLVGYQIGIHVNREEIWWDGAHSNSPKNNRVVKLSNEVMRLFGYYIAEGSCNSESNQINLAFNLDEMQIAREVLHTFKTGFGANFQFRGMIPSHFFFHSQ